MGVGVGVGPSFPACSGGSHLSSLSRHLPHPHLTSSWPSAVGMESQLFILTFKAIWESA